MHHKHIANPAQRSYAGDRAVSAPTVGGAPDES